MSNYFENPVELVNHTGGDIAHAKAAWVSTGGMTEEKRARMPALLKSMAEQGHGTPFEHSQLTFLVTSEIASHIQAIRHRAGISFNVESARYREIKDDRLYIPLDWPPDVRAEYEALAMECFDAYHEFVDRLVEAGLSRSRAKESARFIRPYGAMISYYVTFNFRSFENFIRLRRSPHAQQEIYQIANSMLQCVRDIPGNPFEFSLKAFNLDE